MTAQIRSIRRPRSILWKATLALLLITSGGGFWPSASWAASFSRKYDGEIQSAVKRWWPDLPHWKLWKAQLYQESRLDPQAVSPVGARGLAQFMPRTWEEVATALQIADSPHSTHAIEAGAYYMARLRRMWRAERTGLERNQLAQASYNAGAGNVLKAQTFCGDARLWPTIAKCLPKVTGEKNAHETTTYVIRIDRYWKMMELE